MIQAQQKIVFYIEKFVDVRDVINYVVFYLADKISAVVMWL